MERISGISISIFRNESRLLPIHNYISAHDRVFYVIFDKIFVAKWKISWWISSWISNTLTITDQFEYFSIVVHWEVVTDFLDRTGCRYLRGSALERKERGHEGRSNNVWAPRMRGENHQLIKRTCIVVFLRDIDSLNIQSPRHASSVIWLIAPT